MQRISKYGVVRWPSRFSVLAFLATMNSTYILAADCSDQPQLCLKRAPHTRHCVVILEHNQYSYIVRETQGSEPTPWPKYLYEECKIRPGCTFSDFQSISNSKTSEEIKNSEMKDFQEQCCFKNENKLDTTLCALMEDVVKEPLRVEPSASHFFCDFMYALGDYENRCQDSSFKIGFDNNKGELTLNAKAALKKFIKTIHAFIVKGGIDIADINLIVVGHTNRTGRWEWNLELSKLRASIVARYLEHLEPKLRGHIVTEGKGWESPLKGIPEVNWQQRRVEISIIGIPNSK
jgi:outer membrane protein OmpA-like peptidoglycan-associated protein